MAVYGYCRVSTLHQSLNRQVTNILAEYPKAILFKEHYTGSLQNRAVWEKLVKMLRTGDTLVLDSVSRMSRNSAGFDDYKLLYNSGINLIFLNEPYINSSVLDSTKNKLMSFSKDTGNKAVDNYLSGNLTLINEFILAMAEEQIKTAFEQSQKELEDIHSRISQGIRERKAQGLQVGLAKGTTIETKKAKECYKIIQKHSKDFNGSLDDADVMKLCGCSRNTFYKYKRQLKKQQIQ